MARQATGTIIETLGAVSRVKNDGAAGTRSQGAGGHGSGATALGVAAGLGGASSELYRAARVSRDVAAVEKSIATGNPKYAARRLKNIVVGACARACRGVEETVEMNRAGLT